MSLIHKTEPDTRWKDELRGSCPTCGMVVIATYDNTVERAGMWNEVVRMAPCPKCGCAVTVAKAVVDLGHEKEDKKHVPKELLESLRWAFTQVQWRGVWKNNEGAYCLHCFATNTPSKAIMVHKPNCRYITVERILDRYEAEV